MGPAAQGVLPRLQRLAVEQMDLAELVRAAAKGDQRAWEGLIGRFGGLVWSVARAHGLSRADAADVSQTAWLRLVEHLDRLRDPERVGTWLASTTRHEALRDWIDRRKASFPDSNV